MMETAKKSIQNILDKLPEDASYEEILYKIDFNRSINEGIKDIEEGRVLTHEQALERLKKWLK